MSKNVLGLFILCFALQGCMSTVTRLWNGGPYRSEAQDKAYDECFAEYRKIHPAPYDRTKLGPGSKEVQDYMGAMDQYTTGCLKRKGF